MLDNLKRSMNVYQEPELSINDNGTGYYEGVERMYPPGA